ncbi:hypothetical protein ACWE42_16745 [Sutcliffiella cohnii]
MSKKQWIVYSPQVDLYYFDNYEDALKEYEALKEHIMAEGHEEGTQVHLLETIKVATSVVDKNRAEKEGSPKDNGYDFDNWAKWDELNSTIEWEHCYEKEAMNKGVVLNKLKEVIARNLVAWDTSKDKREGLLPEVYLSNKYWYKQLTGEEYFKHKAVKKFNIE